MLLCQPLLHHTPSRFYFLSLNPIIIIRFFFSVLHIQYIHVDFIIAPSSSDCCLFVVIEYIISPRSKLLDHESTIHFSGLNAHHSGCKFIARTPLASIRYLTSCILPNASLTSRLPSARVPPVQKISAEAAARGQTMESRF